MYEIIRAIIAIVGVIIAMVIIPLIKKKTGAEKLSEIVFWVKTAVEAAEQVMKKSDPDGSKRNAYVKDFLATYNISLSDEELDKLIEAAVYEINRAEKEATT